MQNLVLLAEPQLGLMQYIGVISEVDVALFAISILVVFLLIVGGFFFNEWRKRYQVALSPYSGLPLRKASDLPYGSAEKVLRYLYELHQYDNRIISLRKAALCRETGRIFPNCINSWGVIKVDWNFLQKRCPGNYVSWGSLTDSQQEAVRSLHDSLEGFQTNFSSPNPSPRAIDPEYAFAKPGPLYVEPTTKVLIGWQTVPGTIFEVLVVKHPKKPYTY